MKINLSGRFPSLHLRAFRDAVVILLLMVAVLILALNFDEFNGIIAWLYHHDTTRLDVFFTTMVFLLPAIAWYTWRRHRELVEQINRREEAESTTERLEPELQTALADITLLRRLLPICPSCKRIRDNKGDWNQVEVYIEANLDRKLSHGLCPDCARRAYRHKESPGGLG